MQPELQFFPVSSKQELFMISFNLNSSFQCGWPVNKACEAEAIVYDGSYLDL